MGYDFFMAGPAVEQAPLWSRYRNQFPVTDNLLYLNHAAVGPLCRPAAEAMKALADDALQYGSYHYDTWLDAYAGLRVAAARLIGAEPEEIAIVKNTSEGIATVALGLNWQAGDKIVAFRDEFPANNFPWLRLEAKGVQIEWLSAEDGLERIDAACRGARLLTISYVQYLSGYRADLEAIGEICHRHGVFFFVDAIQGLGVIPLDVRRARIHALAADGHKWLLGPEGCGILYIQRDQQDQIEPVEFGWTNVAAFSDYASRDMTLRPSAARYECGTLNTIGICGLRASMEFLLEVGIQQIGEVVVALADQVAAGVAAKGYELLGVRRPESAAGIVSFRKPEVDSRIIVRRLKEQKILAAPRQGWVRVSPHFYQRPDEMDRLLAALE